MSFRDKILGKKEIKEEPMEIEDTPEMQPRENIEVIKRAARKPDENNDKTKIIQAVILEREDVRLALAVRRGEELLKLVDELNK